MIIRLGSTNRTKREALEETISRYEFLSNATIEATKTDSQAPDQPLTLEETITGAINRAKAAYNNCEYSFGIESGFMKTPNTQTGYMELTICAIHDGENTYLGFSPAFQCPQDVMNIITKEKKNLTEACNLMGLTKDQKLGEAEGIIGILTKGRVTRKDYTKQAIMMALIQIENPNLY